MKRELFDGILCVLCEEESLVEDLLSFLLLLIGLEETQGSVPRVVIVHLMELLDHLSDDLLDLEQQKGIRTKQDSRVVLVLVLVQKEVVMGVHGGSAEASVVALNYTRARLRCSGSEDSLE